MKYLTLGILVLAAAAPAKDKDLNWKSGTLLETSYTRETIGSGRSVAIANSSSGDNSNPALGAAAQAATAASIAGSAPRNVTWQYFTIQGNPYKFIVSCSVRRKHKPNVTVNGPIHYSFEGGKFFMLDEDGKYFEMTLLEKALTARDQK